MKPEHVTIVSLLFNLVFSAGFVIAIVTLKSVKKKAAAEASGSEIDNIDKLVKIWKGIADEYRQKLDEAESNYEKISLEVKELTKQVCKLNAIQNKILKLLDKITPDNLEKIVEQIRIEIQNEKS